MAEVLRNRTLRFRVRRLPRLCSQSGVLFWHTKLNFPPFSANRILGQKLFIRTGDDYSEASVHVQPHPAKKRPSETNLKRTLQEFSRSASFLWYSGNSLANAKGSVMVYSVVEGLVETWFAAFIRQEGWRLHATKGVNRENIECLLQSRVFNER